MNDFLDLLPIIDKSRKIELGLDKLGGKTDINIALRQYNDILGGTKQKDNFALAVDRKNQNIFYLTFKDEVLRIPMNNQTLPDVLQVVKKLIDCESPIYIKGRFEQRTIYADDSFLSDDTLLAKVEDTGCGRLQRENQIKGINNHAEEFFRFAITVRKNPKDVIESSILDENGQIGLALTSDMPAPQYRNDKIQLASK